MADTTITRICAATGQPWSDMELKLLALQVEHYGEDWAVYWQDAATIIHSQRIALTAAHAARDAAERTSEGRLRQLLLKAEEARQEWTRAENASAVRDALMEKLTTALRERDEARAKLEGK